jgi:steroid delta-isomerase-like uncharacterized protein
VYTVSVEENKALIRLVFEEAFNRGNLTIVDKVFSSHFVDHSTPDQSAGPQGVKDYFMSIHTGFPDMHVAVDALIAEGDQVAVRTIWRGTHLGEYEGVAATGGQVMRTLIQIFRIEDGKIVEEWNEGGGLLDSVQRDSE